MSKKTYIAIKDRDLSKKNENANINWEKDDVFTLIKKVPPEKAMNKVESVELKKENEIISFIFSKKEFSKNFKLFKKDKD